MVINYTVQLVQRILFDKTGKSFKIRGADRQKSFIQQKIDPPYAKYLVEGSQNVKEI